MAIYLKKFENHTQYDNYINGSDAILPNVSICTTEGDVHYNPWVETRVVAKYNVTSISSPTQIVYSTSNLSAIEIDGVVQPSVPNNYYFKTTGEHTIKYALVNPTSIVDSAFQYCTSLTSIDIPDSVTSIGNSAIYQCTSLTSINIPDSVTNIGFFGLAYCSGLTSCTISNGITNLSYGVFYSCTGLTSINIPSGVTSIGQDTFSNCTSLISIKSNATTAPTILSNTFQNVKTGGTLTVPIGSSGYDVWMGTGDYYLGKYNWTKVEQ